MVSWKLATVDDQLNGGEVEEKKPAGRSNMIFKKDLDLTECASVIGLVFRGIPSCVKDDCIERSSEKKGCR